MKEKSSAYVRPAKVWLMAAVKGLLLIIMPALLITSCANIGTPSGGPRDEDPPRFVTANPAPGALNVDKTKMVLTFDELINLKDAFNKVVVSPTSRSVPRVTSSGRRVTIEFDSLADNATYTVDFADAIEDNNEGNPLQGFAYTFSTGPRIDTLRISGRVLGARDMEPQQGMIVGVHPKWNNPAAPDTAFTKTRLLRVAKTDDRGRFTIRGLAPGEYRLFALADKDGDYAYSSPEEDIAFLDYTVNPTSRPATVLDTVYNPLTGLPDTVTERVRTLFLPNDVVLRSFNSEVRQQYLTKYERLDSSRLFIRFNTRSDSLPRMRLLGADPGEPIGVLERSERLDSLVWWLTPELTHRDSIKLVVDYTRTDAALRGEAVSDTLGFYTKKAPAPKKKKGKVQRVSATDSIAAITTRFNVLSQVQDVHLPLEFEVPAPLAMFDTAAVHLEMMVDSVYVPARIPLAWKRTDPGNPRRYAVDYPWDYGAKYRLRIDSLAATDIYGKPSLPLDHEFTVKGEGDYCSLLFHISGIPAGVSSFVELLSGSDAVQRVAQVENSEAYFPYLVPGKYYARLVLDANGNGEYDTGNYSLGMQPELAYYYPKAINVKKNWDKEEQWALWDQPVDMMKPAAVTKNKPASDRRARQRDEENAAEEEEDDYFDPTENPFDPNDKAKRRRKNRTAGSY